MLNTTRNFPQGSVADIYEAFCKVWRRHAQDLSEMLQWLPNGGNLLGCSVPAISREIVGHPSIVLYYGGGACRTVIRWDDRLCDQIVLSSLARDDFRPSERQFARRLIGSV